MMFKVIPSRGVLIGIALALAALALGIALFLRHSQPPVPADAMPAAVSSAASAAHPLTTEQLEHSVATMQERVKANPSDATSWAMLAHSYDMLGRYADASTSYARLVELLPNDPQVLADAADSLALANGGKLAGAPMKLVERALALDANNLKALSLAATEALERKDPAAAIGYWQRARAQIKDATLGQEIDAGIALARAQQARAASGAGDVVGGRIVLADKLKDRVAAGDSLFVFARPVEGSRMPVALMRRRAGELPLEFQLDDSMAMVPQNRLSLQSRVVIGARISKRGDATPSSGDLQGFSAPVSVGTVGLKVEITEVIK
jgi:cytochrome c-type biogenesis protein CcmH